MEGNPYTKSLDAQWAAFLQQLCDAVVFKTTAPSFPQDLWAPNGVGCSLS